LKRVHAAQRERQLGTDDGQAGPLSLDEMDHGVKALQVARDAADRLRHAAVAGRADDFSNARTALDRPGKRMLAPTGTKDQDFHKVSTPGNFIQSQKN